jgi:C-terminal processing protease CtpA/Prc
MKIISPVSIGSAVKDNDRGIVGRRSFGKGLVQREMDFDDGSAVRLTVADIIRLQVARYKSLS